MKKITLVLSLISVLFAQNTFASHAPAPVSDRDHVGMGNFTGSYTHDDDDHVWFIFNANAGDTIHFDYDNGFTTYFWVYRSNYNCVLTGHNYNNNDMTLLGGYEGYTEYEEPTSGSPFFIVSQTGQYAIQMDAYLGGSGSYDVTLYGSTATSSLCTEIAINHTDPVNDTVCVGNPAQFSISVTGSYTGQQWQQFNGTTWSNVSSGNGLTYNISSPNSAMNGYLYRCIVILYNYRDTTASATLTVYAGPEISGISSSLNPSINGYAPMQCANLTVSASGGNGTLTYNWSPSGSGNPFNVCPTVGTWYQVTVIDSLGCQDTMSFKQSVKNAAGPQGRVYVCHLNNPRRPQYYTLAVTTAQVPYYIGLGATFGPCNSQPTKIGESEIVDLEDIYKIYPNPFSTELNIEFFSLFEEDVNITLTDMSGREVKTLMNERVYEGSMNRISTDASDLPSGIYMIRYVSDSDIRVQKVILNR